MREYLESEISRVLASIEGVPDDFEIELEAPKNPDHGDLSTNAAMKLARYLRQAPRNIANDLVSRLSDLPLDSAKISEVSIAGAGFINFRFNDEYLLSGLREVLARGKDYGKSEESKGSALVEYVSANPTGPLTVGHGRNAVLGDTIANLLQWSGYDVTREYYFNDAGRQMRVLGESVSARYRQLVDASATGEATQELVSVKPDDFPEDGYEGEYIIDIAQRVRAEHGDSMDAENSIFLDTAVQAIFKDIETTLGRIQIRMDSYFNERSLYDSNAIWRVVDDLREKGLAFDEDGAVWFKTSALGKDKDTVLVKSSGEPTYRLPDIAYHVDKLDRSFDVVVDVFGADHIATFPDVVSGVEQLGYDASRIRVIIYQFVTLVRGGQPVKMSTRKANYVTLDELIDEVGEDVARFFFLMRAPGTHLEFDLDLAKEASDKNPVFYLQYAHARICSILRKVAETDMKVQTDESADLSLLSHPAEVALIKTLLRLPAVIESSADTSTPHRVASYLREVAVAFSDFYQNCRIIGQPEDLASTRLVLARATRVVLANGLTVLGITAPERM